MARGWGRHRSPQLGVPASEAGHAVAAHREPMRGAPATPYDVRTPHDPAPSTATKDRRRRTTASGIATDCRRVYLLRHTPVVLVLSVTKYTTLGPLGLYPLQGIVLHTGPARVVGTGHARRSRRRSGRERQRAGARAAALRPGTRPARRKNPSPARRSAGDAVRGGGSGAGPLPAGQALICEYLQRPL